MKRIKNLSTAAVLAFTLLLGTVHAQPYSTTSNGSLFREAGKSTLTLSGGTPFTAFAEYAISLSNGFTIGAIAAAMPMGAGAGLSLRGIVVQPSNRFRIYMKGDALYYPGSAALGGKPWFLLRPALNGEWVTNGGTRLWGGVGAVITLDTQPTPAMDGMMNSGMSHKEMTQSGMNGMPMKEPEMSVMPMNVGNSICHTFQLGISQPITNNITAQAEVSAVMNGWHFTTMTEWLSGKPIIASLGMSYGFN